MNDSADQLIAPSRPDTGPAKLCVLGGFSLSDSSGQPIELKARKSRLLLAYLAVPPGQVRTREQLAALLWSDRQDDQARASLRTALTGIRRALGEDVLVVDQDTVSLRRGHLETDHDRLKALLVDGGPISKLDEFYGGAFLAGIEFDSDPFMDWLRVLRVACADLAIKVLEANAERLESAGEHQQAIELLRDSLSLEPLKEQTHRTIMKLYAAKGERAMALAQYRTCKELLLHELATVPDPETQALADAIALNNPAVSEELHEQAILLRQQAAAPAMAANPRPPIETSMPSIAVLPFVNMSGDAEQNYFADGMTEDIITDLSNLDGLSVAAKSSSQIFRGTPMSAAQISSELGVRYVLEGSVRKAGNSVRISAQLNDSKTNLQIWGERYDRKLDNIFEIQSEISLAIVNAMELNLLATAEKSTDTRPTGSVEAYQFFLRGQMALQDRSKPNIKLAYELFKQAVAIDPGYALAHAGVAKSACQLVLHYDVDRAILVEALGHCDTALKIHSNMAEAFSARGFVRILENESDKARVDITRALSLAPDLADAHFRMGQYHLTTDGGIEQARHSFKSAFDLNHDLETGMFLTMCVRGQNEPEELRKIAKELLNIAQRRFSLNPHDSYAVYSIASALGDLEQEDEARHWASIASSFDTEDGAMHYNLACLHSTMGSIDQSLAMLEKTLELGCNEVKVRYMKFTDPDLDLLRSDPRFDELLEKHGYGFAS